ncbi:dipeptidase [Micromonospora qiuiae]|uniref:Dipeptidase n=1 Tax=Micromonospora qiuiae TaxID=502268 RepID=A0ABQ4JFC6_9ACTN|nr:M20/M25/M40 family metallo-hydrolase [Micromonospora qiuiae]GIJ28760.1 dipeptidase [Micromonospora qiuiae]
MTLSDTDLRAAIAREMPGVRADLERLVRIPSIAFDGFDHAYVDESAAVVAELLRGCGLDTQIVRQGGQPAVIGHRAAPPGAQTVLLYAHHDVHPIGDPALWTTDPFEPVERDGRLYGRGAADDKAGVMAHVAALRAFGDALPVGVVVFVEGEEECRSVSLAKIVAAHADTMRSDVVVIADSTNWDIGRPALTTSLRGLVNLTVEVRGPDALTALVRLLATLHDDDGAPAVHGLVGREGVGGVDYPEDRFRQESGILDGVRLIGRGSIADRIWSMPAISVLGIDASGGAATAKIGVRVAPGDEPASVFDAVRAHLERFAPRGADVEVVQESGSFPCVIDATGPAYEAARAAFTTAWDGMVPVEIGVGGSIPIVALFQELFPHASILVTGVEDPYTGAHGPNESLHLAEFERVCLAEALLLRNVAAAVSK